MGGNLEGDLQDRVVLKMRAKGLNGLTITREQLRFQDSMFIGGAAEARLHGVFTQRLGNGAKAVVAVRIARMGAQDLEISWRLFERNERTEWNQTFLPFAGAFAVLIGTVLAGLNSRGSLADGSILYSLLLMIIGLGLVVLLLLVSLHGFSKKIVGRPTTSTYQQHDTLVLGETVRHILLLSLGELGVQPHELIIVRQARLVGK
jgi:hypothetical protein